MKDKAFSVIGVVVLVGFLAYIVRDRYLYVTATAARIQTLEAAGVLIFCAIVSILIVTSLFAPLPVIWRRFRNKSE